MTSEQHAFVAGAAMIRHVIHSQAGTLAKALAEAVTNAIDAHATGVDITLTPTGYTIVDDGIGMQTREEVLRCFKELGFEHDDRARMTGQFGLGRAQLWAFSRNSWRTHAFRLDVDVRGKGEGFLLTSDCEPAAGMRIEGTYYEPRKEVQQVRDLEELTQLVRYLQVPVRVNGKQINVPPATEKWDEETDEAYIRASNTQSLKVYSQGLFVREYASYHVGVAGVMVTKIGHPLRVNVSRNDVLVDVCPLWKRLKARLRALADKRAERRTHRTTDADRDFYARRIAEEGGLQFLSKDLFTLADRRHVSFEGLYRRACSATLLSVSDGGNASAESALRNRSAVVLHPATLSRFGASTLDEFIDTLTSLINARADTGSRGQSTQAYQLDTLAKLPRFDDFRASPLQEKDEYRILAVEALSERERAVLAALRTSAEYQLPGLARAPDGPRAAVRRLLPGCSKTALAWTDGQSYIAIDRHLLRDAAAHGLRGMAKLIHVLIHEYVHDVDSAGSHLHDHDFFEHFHDATIHNAADISRVIDEVVKSTVRAIAKKSKVAAQRLDAIAERDADAARGPKASNDVPMQAAA